MPEWEECSPEQYAQIAAAAEQAYEGLRIPRVSAEGQARGYRRVGIRPIDSTLQPMEPGKEGMQEATNRRYQDRLALDSLPGKPKKEAADAKDQEGRQDHAGHA